MRDARVHFGLSPTPTLVAAEPATTSAMVQGTSRSLHTPERVPLPSEDDPFLVHVIARDPETLFVHQAAPLEEPGRLEVTNPSGEVVGGVATLPGEASWFVPMTPREGEVQAAHLGSDASRSASVATCAPEPSSDERVDVASLPLETPLATLDALAAAAGREGESPMQTLARVQSQAVALGDAALPATASDRVRWFSDILGIQGVESVIEALGGSSEALDQLFRSVLESLGAGSDEGFPSSPVQGWESLALPVLASLHEASPSSPSHGPVGDREAPAS